MTLKGQLTGWYKPLGAVVSTVVLAGAIAFAIGKLAGFQTVGEAQAASVALEQRLDAKIKTGNDAVLAELKAVAAELREQNKSTDRALQRLTEQSDVLLRAHMPSPRTKE